MAWMQAWNRRQLQLIATTFKAQSNMPKGQKAKTNCGYWRTCSFLTSFPSTVCASFRSPGVRFSSKARKATNCAVSLSAADQRGTSIVASGLSNSTLHNLF